MCKECVSYMLKGVVCGLFAMMTTGNGRKLMAVYIHRVLCNIHWKHTSRREEDGDDGALQMHLFTSTNLSLFMLFSKKNLNLI